MAHVGTDQCAPGKEAGFSVVPGRRALWPCSAVWGGLDPSDTPTFLLLPILLRPLGQWPHLHFRQLCGWHTTANAGEVGPREGAEPAVPKSQQRLLRATWMTRPMRCS